MEYLVRSDNLLKAFELVSKLDSQCGRYSLDVYYRIRLLITKANLFAKCGKAEKGLSIAVRAVTAAYQTRAVHLLWEAAGALAVILISLEHFQPAHNLLEAVVYQVCALLPTVDIANVDTRSFRLWKPRIPHW